MADDQDDSQKTEDPTQKRLDDAFKKGQVVFSREVTSFLMLLVFAISIVALAPNIGHEINRQMGIFVGNAHLYSLDGRGAMDITLHLLKTAFFLMIIPILILMLTIIISAIAQHGFIFAIDPVAPKLERISLTKGIKRMFSLKSIMEFVKGVIKICIIAAISLITLYPELHNLQQVISYSIEDIMLLMLTLSVRILVGACSAMALIAALDYLYQQFEHVKSMRMSFKDIKDEFKQTEGSPEVKAKLREIRNKRANERMAQAVPSADVIITNPTHYSIALKYDELKNSAPIVIAKGKDLTALKIREIAKENEVPLVENPPLARALYASVEIDQEIPIEHYNAVAEIIRYVYKLKGKQKVS